MAVLKRYSKADLLRTFTHRGWFALCPVYLSNPEAPAGPYVAERNWIPEWWMSANEALVGGFIALISLFDPLYEPMFPFLITGPIERK